MLEKYFNSPARLQALRDRPLVTSFESFAQVFAMPGARVDPSVKLETLGSVLAPKLRIGRFKATDKLLAAIKQRIVSHPGEVDHGGPASEEQRVDLALGHQAARLL